MQTPKEIFLELLKPNGRPERVLKQYEALYMCLNDPINTHLRGNRRRGSVSRDRWGTTISFPADAPGAIPVHTDDLTVCPDVTHWEETVHAPDLAASCTAGWEDCRAAARSAAGEEKLLAGFMGTGIFEQCHFLMGFENTLTALYEHPDEMHRLIDYITDYRLGYVKLLIDNLHPDVIFSHDDWGTKDALFMHPDMWRAFFKEPYRRFYGYIRSRGCIAIHHADSYLVPIVDDMAEIGIQVWQGVLPENDIPALQRRLQGKLVLMGGIGAAIDRSDATAGEVCDYTRRTLRACCPGGHFIPSITYGLPGAVYPHIDRYIDETIDAYNAGVHLPVFPLPPEPRRSLTPRASAPAAAVSETPAEQGEDLLAAVAAATKRGQQKKLLTLVDKALSRGISAQDILSGGLIKGMNDLGEDFSASRAFVPEMLMAARCMSAATAQLKLHLVDGGGVRRTIGSACIGTVRGDMHDIGKNLVKIMLEGSNIEVYDLGADVAPETFIQAAREHHCDIIACSALLTTTMQQMRRVVELARESGIRDRVCIMVGGAPISQSFCDEIHADLYTPDAASAARAAVDRLTHPAK